MSTIIIGFTSAGIITPEEARSLAQGVLNTELQRINEPWVKQPLTLTMAVLGKTPPAGKPEPGGVPMNAEQVRTQKPPMGSHHPTPGSEALEGIQPPIPTGQPITPVALSKTVIEVPSGELRALFEE
jgi:hypothetical protein